MLELIMLFPTCRTCRLASGAFPALPKPLTTGAFLPFRQHRARSALPARIRSWGVKRSARGGGAAMKEGAGSPVGNHKLETFIDIFIFVANQVILRNIDCTSAETCAIPAVLTAARIFFTLCNTLLISVFCRQLMVAKQMEQTKQVSEDVKAMTARLKKTSIKCLILLSLHLCFGLVAPLIASSFISIVALPFWWDRDNSYWRRYGMGRRK
eukprot:TRINITY_DN21569_c0_g1_i2.p2 TRINITY_DN21569_c0_g1~~TRINITY_DN21569_c0_g1_i2.p2  ORF type:complete len:211 (+),score=31.17 TRINITY_DN21569_c0_g1_i2:3-635(+)